MFTALNLFCICDDSRKPGWSEPMKTCYKNTGFWIMVSLDCIALTLFVGGIIGSLGIAHVIGLPMPAAIAMTVVGFLLPAVVACIVTLGLILGALLFLMCAQLDAGPSRYNRDRDTNWLP